MAKRKTITLIYNKDRRDKNVKKQEHIYYFDYLRLFAFISVIFMHVAAGPLRQDINANWYVTNLLTCLAFTAVPVFFMMSGYLLMSSDKTANVSTLKHRLPRLVVPLAFWSAVIIAKQMYINRSLDLRYLCSQILEALHGPIAVHLWFIYTIIAIYIISPFLYNLIHNLNKGGHKLLLLIIAAVNIRHILYVLIPEPFRKVLDWNFLNQLELFNGYLCVFFLGYYLASTEKHISNKLLLIVSAVCLGIITLGTWYFTVKSGEFNQKFQQQNKGFEVLLASCIFLLAKQNLNRDAKVLGTIIKPLVALSLPIYFSHNILLSILSGYGMQATTFLSIVGETLLIFAICYICAKTAASFRPFCFLVNGISYESAKKSANWQYTIGWIKKRKKSST